MTTEGTSTPVTQQLTVNERVFACIPGEIAVTVIRHYEPHWAAHLTDGYPRLDLDLGLLGLRIILRPEDILHVATILRAAAQALDPLPPLRRFDELVPVAGAEPCPREQITTGATL